MVKSNKSVCHIRKYLDIAKSRFHSTHAVLACGSDGQVTIFDGANGSIPFSNWRIEREFKSQKLKKDYRTGMERKLFELN